MNAKQRKQIEWMREKFGDSFTELHDARQRCVQEEAEARKRLRHPAGMDPKEAKNRGKLKLKGGPNAGTA